MPWHACKIILINLLSVSPILRKLSLNVAMESKTSISSNQKILYMPCFTTHANLLKLGYHKICFFMKRWLNHQRRVCARKQLLFAVGQLLIWFISYHLCGNVDRSGHLRLYEFIIDPQITVVKSWIQLPARNITMYPNIHAHGFVVICLVVISSYRKTSNISHTSVSNDIVDNSDVVGASPVGAAPTTSSFST